MKSYQVVGIGNAIVDVIAPSSDQFLQEMAIDKGVMQLIDADRGEALYAAMTERRQAPGGSVANSIAGIGALGLSTAFVGRVRADELGEFYAKSMRDEGTEFTNAPVAGADLPTSRSMIFVSPDGERSMNTYLGISSEFGPEDLPADFGKMAQILLLEGYLYDKDHGKAALEQAARDVRAAGGKAGISLSDPFCVDRHRAAFRALITGLDFVIGNEHEWASLYEAPLEAALAAAAKEIPLVVCTCSGSNVVILAGGERVEVAVDRIDPVDTTGAGDQFAAGFLYGLATGASLAVAGQMGCVAAAEVISHYGARPEQDVKALFKAKGLI